MANISRFCRQQLTKTCSNWVPLGPSRCEVQKSVLHTSSICLVKPKKPQKKVSLEGFTDNSHLQYLSQTPQKVSGSTQSDYEMLKKQGFEYLPRQMTEYQTSALAELPNPYDKKAFLRSLYHRNQYLNTDNWADEYEEFNSPFDPRLHSQAASWMENVYNHRLVTSKQLGENIVYDFSHISHMNIGEMFLLADELAKSLDINRRYKDPFNMKFFNYDVKDENNIKVNTQYIQNLHSKDCLVDIYSEDYTAHLPKGKLMYLSPMAAPYTDLDYVDSDTIYVIPAVLNRRDQHAAVQAKAKRLGVEMRKLPLQRFMECKALHLPLHVTLNILLEYKHNGSWKKAFEKLVPRDMLPNGRLKWKSNNVEKVRGPKLILVPPMKKKAFPKLQEWLADG